MKMRPSEVRTAARCPKRRGRLVGVAVAVVGLVAIDNRAVDGKTSDQLRTEVTNDAALRRTIAQADVILIGIGGADLNAGDDALSAGSCKGRACYAEILRRFAANMSAIASEARR